MRYDLSRPKTAYRLRKSVLTANDLTDLPLPDIWTNGPPPGAPFNCTKLSLAAPLLLGHCAIDLASAIKVLHHGETLKPSCLKF